MLRISVSTHTVNISKGIIQLLFYPFLWMLPSLNLFFTVLVTGIPMAIVAFPSFWLHVTASLIIISLLKPFSGFLFLEGKHHQTLRKAWLLNWSLMYSSPSPVIFSFTAPIILAFILFLYLGSAWVFSHGWFFNFLVSSKLSPFQRGLCWYS